MTEGSLGFSIGIDDGVKLARVKLQVPRRRATQDAGSACRIIRSSEMCVRIREDAIMRRECLLLGSLSSLVNVGEAADGKMAATGLQVTESSYFCAITYPIYFARDYST